MSQTVTQKQCIEFKTGLGAPCAHLDPACAHAACWASCVVAHQASCRTSPWPYRGLPPFVSWACRSARSAVLQRTPDRIVRCAACALSPRPCASCRKLLSRIASQARPCRGLYHNTPNTKAMGSRRVAHVAASSTVSWNLPGRVAALYHDTASCQAPFCHDTTNCIVTCSLARLLACHDTKTVSLHNPPAASPKPLS